MPLLSDDSEGELDGDDDLSLYVSASNLESSEGSNMIPVAMSELAPLTVINKDDPLCKHNNIPETMPPDHNANKEYSSLLELGPQPGQKRKLDDTDSLSVSSMESSRSLAPGQSKSAVHARERRKALKDGTLIIDLSAREAWKAKLRKLDSLVEFDDKNLRSARHSGCGEYIRMKDIGDTTRFKEHMKTCTSVKSKATASGRTPSLFTFGFGRRNKEDLCKPQAKAVEDHQKVTLMATSKVLCPGLSEADDSRIPPYLYRTSALSGGGQSITAVAKEHLGRLYRDLTAEEKDKVADIQRLGHKWTNDHRRLRVFSTSCVREKVVDTPASGRILPCNACLSVLKLNGFNSALNRKVKDETTYIFTPKMYRDPVLGQIYARTVGLKEILETSVCFTLNYNNCQALMKVSKNAKTTPCVRYAVGVLKGKYDNAVFNGLLEAVVTKYDKEERGVGLQNFRYAPAWDEMCHIISIQSPRTYRALLEFLPGRSIRNFR